jgi:hypothetical protein
MFQFLARYFNKAVPAKPAGVKAVPSIQTVVSIPSGCTSMTISFDSVVVGGSTTGDVPPVGTGSPIQGIDTPDEHGFVALTGLSPESWYAGKRYAIKEVADSLEPGPAKDCATANVNYANAEYLVADMIPAGRELGSGTVMPQGDNIPDTFGVPSHNRSGAYLDTVAKATKYFNQQPNPVTGAPFPHV